MEKRAAEVQAISWLNVAIGLFLAGRGFWKIYEGQMGIWTWIGLILGLYWLGAEVYKWSKRNAADPTPVPSEGMEEPDDETSEDEPLRSLVLLLDAPWDISDTAWIEHVGSALGVKFSQDDPNAVNFITPIPHPISETGGSCFMMAVPVGMFWIFNSIKPYVENTESLAQSTPDRRMRESIVRHRAWLSVDLLHLRDDTAGIEQAYDIIGKTIAALVGPDVLGIFSPELGRLNEFDPMLIPVLAGGSPLSLFEGSTFAPVIETESDDEQMEAAIAEARRRWPEFVESFQRSGPSNDVPFLVKAPFTADGETEHMWMEVTGLTETEIHGTLANQPHHLTNYHQGQSIKVPSATLSDWICLGRDQKPVGGWTQNVLASRQPRS